MEEVTHASIRFLLYGILFGMLLIMLIDTLRNKPLKGNAKLIDNMNKITENGTTKKEG
jgi:hypothetical protein|tara:strand:- start:221 stop:394 length:174 start_codon:yes stop_codon:yes gene_type:complete